MYIIMDIDGLIYYIQSNAFQVYMNSLSSGHL